MFLFLTPHTLHLWIVRWFLCCFFSLSKNEDWDLRIYHWQKFFFENPSNYFFASHTIVINTLVDTKSLNSLNSSCFKPYGRQKHWPFSNEVCISVWCNSNNEWIWFHKVSKLSWLEQITRQSFERALSALFISPS